MIIHSYLRRIYHLFEKAKRKRYIDTLLKNGLNLGKNIEIIDTFFFDPSHCFLISIGDNCTICPNVRLVAHDASTKKILGYTKIGRIDIKENCFIGDSAIILPGVTVGPNSIVGAGAIVTRDVRAKMIAAKNPAKVISSVENYIKKIANISENKKIFTEDYFISKLDESKRKEIIKSVGNTIGLIV